MLHKKQIKSLLHYYLLLSSLTNLVFAAIWAILFYLIPGAELDTLTAFILFLFLMLKSLLVGFLVYAAHKRGSIDRATGTRFIGMYFGRFFGLILGVYVGARMADLVGAVAGGVLLYFTGRWVGPEISKLIGHLLDHVLPAAGGAGNQAFRPSPSRRLLLAVYAAVFPILLVLGAVYVRATGITFDGFPTDWLPVARWVVIVISLYSLVLPWRFRQRMDKNPTPIPFIDMFWLGLAFSVVPVCYGFFLFTLGASIVELGIFAVASSLAATYWSDKNNSASQESGSAPASPLEK